MATPKRTHWFLLAGVGLLTVLGVLLLAVVLGSDEKVVDGPAADPTAPASTTDPGVTTTDTAPTTTAPPATTEPAASTTEPPASTAAPATTEPAAPPPGDGCPPALQPGDELVACRPGPAGSDPPAAIVHRGAGDDAAWFTTMSPFTGVEHELGAPTAHANLGDVVTFTADVAIPGAGDDEPELRCLLVVGADRAGWRESCWTFGEPAPASLLADVDGRLIQFDLDDDGSVRGGHDLAGGVWPASGCDSTNAGEVASAVADSAPWTMIGGLRCDGERTNLAPESPATAVATVGGVFLQTGGPDGGIFVLDRTAGAWTVTDFGTGLEETAMPVPPFDRWTTWPGDTAPVGGPVDIPPLDDPPTLDLDEMAARVVDHIVTTTPADDEFPVVAEVVEVVDDLTTFDPLLVVRATQGGDDSVGGGVLFAWLSPVFDTDSGTQAGWEVATAYRSLLCVRGVDVTGPLCV